MPEDFDFTPVVDEIRKQNEGVTLGLGALAESLDKLVGHLSKQDEEEEGRKREEEVEEEQKAFVKAVEAIINQKLEETGEKGERKVSSGGGDTAASAPDAPEKDADKESIRNKPEKSQEPIAAMKKQDEEEMQDEEEEKEEGEEYPEIEAMKKENTELKTKLSSIEKSVESEIQKAVDSKLRKMGWKEERSLVSPKVVKKELGDDSPPIIKSDEVKSSDDMVDELSKLSFRALNELSMKIEAGDTEGIPQELIKALS